MFGVDSNLEEATGRVGGSSNEDREQQMEAQDGLDNIIAFSTDALLPPSASAATVSAVITKERRLSLAKLQIPPRTTDGVELCHSSSSSDGGSGGGGGGGSNKWSNVPLPLSASKSSKFSAHGLLPHPGLRSRTTPLLEKNVQALGTPGSESSSIISPGVVSTKLSSGAKRTTSLPVRTSINISSSSSNSLGARLGIDYISQETTTASEHEVEKVNIARLFSMPMQRLGRLRRADSGNKCLVVVRPAPLTLTPNSSDNATMNELCLSTTTQVNIEKGAVKFFTFPIL